MPFQFKIEDPQLLQEINAASSNMWAPPPSAKARRDTKLWSDAVDVIDAGVEEDSKTPGRLVVTVDFQCAADSPPNGADKNPNIGRRHREWYRVTPAAASDPGHPDRQMSVISASALRTLAIAGDLLGDDESGDILVHFLPQGEDEPAPIVGTKVFARVRQYVDKQGTPRQELSRFLPITES